MLQSACFVILLALGRLSNGYRIEWLATTPPIIVVRGLLSPEECTELRQLASNEMEPSMIGGAGSNGSVRISFSRKVGRAFTKPAPHRAQSPVADALQSRAVELGAHVLPPRAKASRAKASLGLGHIEAVELVRYNEGGR